MAAPPSSRIVAIYPGSFDPITNGHSLQPIAPHYDGNIVILTDELSISQAEYNAMAFRAAPGAVVVGSATAGADGDVSPFIAPGIGQTQISGIGVFYLDGRPTQRIGIVPDIEAHPTIEGIRDGRDEVREAEIRVILGAATQSEEIREMARSR